MEATMKNLEIIRNISKKNGLIVNEKNSKILIFKKRNDKKIGKEKKK